MPTRKMTEKQLKEDFLSDLIVNEGIVLEYGDYRIQDAQNGNVSGYEGNKQFAVEYARTGKYRFYNTALGALKSI